MILLIDNFDSFVYNLARYAVESGEEVKVVRNNAITIEQIRLLNPQGIILSPGPRSPNEAGICLEVVKQLYTEFPILGVCLGHQTIGQVFGGDVVRAIAPIHGKTEVIKHSGTGVFQEIANPTTVTRYHSLVVDMTNAKELKITSKTDKGEVMAFEHESLPVHGVQFHPEAVLTECGRKIMENFIHICKKNNYL